MALTHRLVSLAEPLALDTRCATIAPARSGTRGKPNDPPQCPKGMPGRATTTDRANASYSLAGEPAISGSTSMLSTGLMLARISDDCGERMLNADRGLVAEQAVFDIFDGHL
jgi:hypothetical protein